jgi:hypothetical protein
MNLNLKEKEANIRSSIIENENNESLYTAKTDLSEDEEKEEKKEEKKEFKTISLFLEIEKLTKKQAAV